MLVCGWRRRWWDSLCANGPMYVYFPLPAKTVLIVKDEHRDLAEQIFQGSGVTITTGGKRHMGAVIGSEEFKTQYVSSKIEKWTKDIHELSRLARDEPQAVYSCYTKAICHRQTYIQRTIPGIGDLFKPLEDAIRDELIPSICGRTVSNIEWHVLALPVRLGGLGLGNPVETADDKFNASCYITPDLVSIIKNQDSDFSNLNQAIAERKVKDVKLQKEARLKEKQTSLMEELGPRGRRMIELCQEKGAGAWLNVLPIKSLGYTLNKQAFRDSICLRYDW